MSSDWDRLSFGYYGALHVDVARKFRKPVWSLVSMAGSQYPRLSDKVPGVNKITQRREDDK